ncbi:uncharacterized protein LOC128342175 [Hemicordylus capensis]|uniref:uncharacterized protein LOC128342175 n=1 Tax=Hemicordylus capensis TaxID=884348 RepID=UPI00230232B0|nr:uncharacterized protein LOC128342175 [Hemicordylus capensis]
MAFSFCCCCPCLSLPSSEREPLNTPHSRQPRQDTQSALFSKDEALTFKRVNLPETDTVFASIAKTFNKQQDDWSAIRKAIQSLKELYHCSVASSLSVCMEKIQQEHYACSVQVHMEGYRFWLEVKEKEIPEKLKKAQQQVGELNLATKGVISTATQLEEMLHSVLQDQDDMVKRVQTANPAHLDWIRIKGNLRENIEKINLATQLSRQYKEEANSVLTEMSKSASLTM